MGNILRKIRMPQRSKYGSKRLFLPIDRTNFNKNVNFTFPTKYYKESHNIMVAIGTNLYRYHRTFIRQLFSSLAQETILNTT